jgi:hypothetical protein
MLIVRKNIGKGIYNSFQDNHEVGDRIFSKTYYSI